MDSEYQRLQDMAREVDREILELEQNSEVSSAAELAAMERREIRSGLHRRDGFKE